MVRLHARLVARLQTLLPQMLPVVRQQLVGLHLIVIQVTAMSMKLELRG